MKEQLTIILEQIKKFLSTINVLIAGSIYVFLYPALLVVLHGHVPKSISNGAKLIINSGYDILLIMWFVVIVVICIKVFYEYLEEKQSLILALTGTILLPLSYLTGYSGLLSTKLENILHVIPVNISIPFILLYIIWDGWVNNRKWLSLIFSSTFVIFTVLSMIIGYKTHTFWIEIYALAIIIFYLLIKIIKLCQKEVLKKEQQR